MAFHYLNSTSFFKTSKNFILGGINMRGESRDRLIASLVILNPSGLLYSISLLISRALSNNFSSGTILETKPIFSAS